MNWDLTRLYRDFDDPRLMRDFEAIETRAPQEAQALDSAQRGADAVPVIERALQALNELTDISIRLDGMLMLTRSVDATNARAGALMDRFFAAMNQMSRLTSALSRYLGGVEDLEAVIAQSETLKAHAHYLRRAQAEARHLIPQALEETVLNMQATGSRAWEQLRNTLDGTLTIEFEQDGERRGLSLAQVRALAYDPDADVRRRAYEAELAAYPAIEHSMAACLNGIKGESLTVLALRGYESALDQSLTACQMDRETLGAMLSAMKESLPAFRRYFKAKARALGHENGLPFYDLFAPMGADTRRFTLDEARAYLIQVLGAFSKKMADFVDRAFEERWIDPLPRPGKTGGAFCMGIPGLEISYILSNFDGSLSAVSTLAHELGHAYHNECMKGLSVLGHDYPMPLAETASIFNETLLSQTALKDADGEQAIQLLDSEITEAAQVIVDILSRYLFETEVFRRRRDHALPPEELKEIMLETQRQSYGDGLDGRCLHPYMWACKSHYYSADLHFYNFPYAFGLLFGKGVYARYRQRGEAFLSEYDALLRATSSGSAREVAARVGIDLTDIEFWRASLREIEEAIDRFVGLVGK